MIFAYYNNDDVHAVRFLKHRNYIFPLHVMYAATVCTQLLYTIHDIYHNTRYVGIPNYYLPITLVVKDLQKYNFTF